MNDVAALQRLQKLKVGTPQRCNGLSVFPLLDDGPDEARYLTLDEALAAGLAHVTEVSDAGRVPELRFRNDGDRPVLLIDGDELVGAKQNRVLNPTILVPPHSEIVIPVSCVEYGRWTWRSRHFDTSNRTLYGPGSP